MKKKAFLALLLSTAVAGTAGAATADAADKDSIVYGTMDIPYSEFYASEGIDGVDAVSSATTSKWFNENLVGGTYSKANEDSDGGTILGVKYYVSLTKETLDSLGENNYNFTQTDEVPAAYKNVTVEDGNVEFSPVIGSRETIEGVEGSYAVSLSTDSKYGDYQLSVENVGNSNGTSSLGTIYGIILSTKEGDSYGMRHLENIWRDEIAWSSGIKTQESHGNTLKYEQYEGIMGQTINSVTYITDTGCHSVTTDIYVPKKFESSVEVSDAKVSDGTTTFTAEGFPSDYEKTYSSEEGFTVSEGKIDFENVLPGNHTLTIKDSNGIYAPVSASFLLTTTDIPVVFDSNDSKVTVAENFTEADLSNYINGITEVEVDGTAYKTGKRGVAIINKDGTINAAAALNDNTVFVENKDYTITVKSVGYEENFSFTYTKTAETDNFIYGTMEIPYNEFYTGEGIDDVDAVSSATTGKWKNEGLVNGTYNQPNEDGTGTILGVKYYVALTEETLSALGENNYSFAEVEETPSAYKVVTVKDGKVSFSAVNGGDVKAEDVTASISTEMVWGDYVIDVTSINNSGGKSDFGTIYGVILNTTDGSKYALRHLQNIWRDELAWSSGFKTTEPHGNTLDYEAYESLMGKTINKIVYITETGYHTVETDLYVPVKFNSDVKVENAKISDGKTTFTAENFPEDYVKTYSVGEGFTVSDGKIEFSDVLPGNYTLSIKDENGVYADVNTAFVLSTETIPVIFDNDNSKLAAAGDSSDEELANYIKNITSVEVDGTVYSTSKRGVTIINQDGTINLEAASGKGDDAVLVFAEKKEYKITVKSTGYENDLEFTFVNDVVVIGNENSGNEISNIGVNENGKTDTSIANSGENSTNTNSGNVNGNGSGSAQQINTGSGYNNNNNTSYNNSSSSNSTNSSNVPSTGAADFAVAAIAVAAVSAGIVFAVRKKKFSESE